MQDSCSTVLHRQHSTDGDVAGQTDRLELQLCDHLTLREQPRASGQLSEHEEVLEAIVCTE